MKYKIGDKVLFKTFLTKEVISATVCAINTGLYDYGVIIPGIYATNLYEREIIRKVSDKPLCRSGKLLW